MDDDEQAVGFRGLGGEPASREEQQRERACQLFRRAIDGLLVREAEASGLRSDAPDPEGHEAVPNFPPLVSTGTQTFVGDFLVGPEERRITQGRSPRSRSPCNWFQLPAWRGPSPP